MSSWRTEYTLTCWFVCSAIPPAPGPAGEIWTTLCELAAAKPDGWTLIGGQMVLLLALEHDAEPTRIGLCSLPLPALKGQVEHAVPKRFGHFDVAADRARSGEAYTTRLHHIDNLQIAHDDCTDAKGNKRRLTGWRHPALPPLPVATAAGDGLTLWSPPRPSSPRPPGQRPWRTHDFEGSPAPPEVRRWRPLAHDPGRDLPPRHDRGHCRRSRRSGDAAGSSQRCGAAPCPPPTVAHAALPADRPSPQHRRIRQRATPVRRAELIARFRQFGREGPRRAAKDRVGYQPRRGGA